MSSLPLKTTRTRRVTAIGIVVCAFSFNFSLSQTYAQSSGASETRAPRTTGSSCKPVSVDSINDANSLARALQGRIPGFSISSTQGHVGSGTSVRMRGNNSVTASNEPLILIDDIPIRSIPTSSITRYSSATRTMNPLDFVDPSEVVHVEVLRGPAATTVYGMQAANGAILIYTKRGQEKGGKRANTRVRCPS